MLYRICDQLVILVRFRHLNGKLKLAGSGNRIDLWGVYWWHTTLAVSGRWGWFTGTCHGGAWLDQGNRIDLWGCAMRKHVTGWIEAMGMNHGTHDTGWSGAMGLIYGGVWHWLEQGDGIDSGGLAMGAHNTGSGWWDWYIWDTSWGHTTGSGSRWDWFELGGTPLGCDTGWDTSWGRDWIREMGLICGGMPWGCDTGWMWMMRLIYGGIPWGRATGSGRWNWFVEANHGAHDTG